MVFFSNDNSTKMSDNDEKMITETVTSIGEIDLKKVTELFLISLQRNHSQTNPFSQKHIFD